MTDGNRKGTAIAIVVVALLAMAFIPFPLSRPMVFTSQGVHSEIAEFGTQAGRNSTIWIVIDSDREVCAQFVWYRLQVSDTRLVLASFNDTHVEFNCTDEFFLEIFMEEPTWIRVSYWYYWTQVDTLVGHAVSNPIFSSP